MNMCVQELHNNNRISFYSPSLKDFVTLRKVLSLTGALPK